MGDPRKIRSKYSTPRHPWEGERIEVEKGLMKDYGLKNKKEIWRMTSLLKGFKDQVKRLNAQSGAQAEKETQQLRTRLNSLGILQKDEPMESVLALDIQTIMDRRLQSVMVKNELARTMKQARQFIIHEHVTVNGNKITVPSYLVREGEVVAFADGSPMKEEMHPERMQPEPVKDKVVKKKDKKTKKEEEEALAYKEDEILDEDEAALAELKKKEKKESESKKEESSKKESKEKEPEAKEEKPKEDASEKKESEEKKGDEK